MILTFVLIGTVAERHATADLGVLLLLGGLGYAMSILKWPRAPLMLAFVLGPLVERRVLLSNTLYGWSWVLRPTVMVLAAAAIALLLAGRRASRRRGGPKPIAREASASRADVVMSACFAAVGAAGLALSLSLTGRPSVFPRIAFGATFGLALLQLALSWRKVASGQSARQPPARGGDTSDPNRLVRVFRRQRLALRPGHRHRGIGACVSAVGREGIVANDARDDHGPGRADVGAGRSASAAVRPGRLLEPPAESRQVAGTSARCGKIGTAGPR